MICKTLYTNANVYTMDDEMPVANWIAVDDGVIQALGMGNPPQAILGRRTIDLGGLTVLPGLIDSHMHGTPTGEMLASVDLRGAKNIDEILARLRTRCEAHHDDSWVVGSGLDSSLLEEKRNPTCFEIDEISADHPVYITTMTLHGCVLNSKGMEIINVPDSLMGIAKDAQGNRTGEFLSDDSSNYVATQFHEKTPDEMLKNYIKNCASWCASKGCTTISHLDGGLFDDTDRDFYYWLSMEDDLPIHLEHFFQTWNVEHARVLGLPRIGGCLTLDGAGFEGTMATRMPYNDGPFPTGVLYHSDEEVYNFMKKASLAGLQFGIHALGDRAIDQYLRCYERVYEEQDLQGNPLHNRIEHFTCVHPEHIEKAARMNLILSMQPIFTWQWDQTVYKWMMPDPDVDCEPYGRIHDAGLLIAGGSDCPVTPVNPLLGIHALVNMPDEKKRLPITEAIKVFTLNGAIASYKEDEKGSISVGKLADLVVLDRDPYKEPESIKDFKVMKTIVSDKMVYQA